MTDENANKEVNLDELTDEEVEAFIEDHVVEDDHLDQDYESTGFKPREEGSEEE